MNSAMNKLVIIGLLTATAGTVAWVATCGAFDSKLAADKTPHPSVTCGVNEAPLSRETKMETSFAAGVKRAAPSVVNIFSTKMVNNPSGQDMRPFLEDPFFRRFFGDSFGGNDPRQQQPRRHKERSLGSGV